MKTFKSFIQSDEINKQAFDESDAYDKDVKASPKPHDKEAAAQRAKLAALAARKKMMTNKMSEAESHQSKTTMKHIDKPNAAEKKAAKDIKPGIKGYQDRVAMRKAAKDRGALKEDEIVEFDEAESHQSKTTMKHISNPTAGEKKAAKDIKPGTSGYRDRIAMLKSAQARGALKKEDVDLLSNLYDQLDENNQEIFLNQLEEDVEVLLAFAKTIAEE